MASNTGRVPMASVSRMTAGPCPSPCPCPSGWNSFASIVPSRVLMSTSCMSAAAVLASHRLQVFEQLLVGQIVAALGHRRRGGPGQPAAQLGDDGGAHRRSRLLGPLLAA